MDSGRKLLCVDNFPDYSNSSILQEIRSVFLYVGMYIKPKKWNGPCRGPCGPLLYMKFT